MQVKQPQKNYCMGAINRVSFPKKIFQTIHFTFRLNLFNCRAAIRKGGNGKEFDGMVKDGTVCGNNKVIHVFD